MIAETVKIIVTEQSDDEQTARNLFPSFRESISRASVRTHDVQLELLSNSLVELLGTLSSIVEEVGKFKGPKPSKLTFTLGVDTNGSVGILSTSASVGHTSSVTVEFEVANAASGDSGGKATDLADR